MVKEIILEAWELTQRHWRLILMNGWPLGIIMLIQQWETLRLQETGDQFSSTAILATIALAIFGTAFMIFSIRLGLHGPPPGSRFALQFKRTEIMYILISILLGIGAGIAFLLAFIPVGLVSLTGVQPLMILTGVISTIAALAGVSWALVRLSLIFVVLTDEREEPGKTSWALTEGQFWLIAGVYFWPILAIGAAAIVLVIPAGVLSMVSTAASLVFYLPFLVINIFATPYFAFLATGMYRRFDANGSHQIDEPSETP